MDTYHVYIIYSESTDSYYIGQISNLEDRLFRHCNSGSKSTKKAKDWKLVYKEVYESRSESVQREREIKNKKSRKYIEQLISSSWLERPDLHRESHRFSRLLTRRYSRPSRGFYGKVKVIKTDSGKYLLFLR
jgi:putative endonuclease